MTGLGPVTHDFAPPCGYLSMCRRLKKSKHAETEYANLDVENGPGAALPPGAMIEG